MASLTSPQTSHDEVRGLIARYMVLLVLFLEKNHISGNAKHILEYDTEHWLGHLLEILSITARPRRPQKDEWRVTSLFRYLLERSGGERDPRQHSCAENHTILENADLLASVIGVACTAELESLNPENMCSFIRQSPVFIKERITSHRVDRWIQGLISHLRVGFPRDYLVCRHE